MTDWRHIRAVDRAEATFRRYLGDGVYAAFDGVGVWLTTEDGGEAIDAIYLEPEVFAELMRFHRDMKSEPTTEGEGPR